MNMKEALAAAIKAAAVKAIAAGTIKEGDLPEVLLEVPPQKEFGDYATNFAMQTARAARTNSRAMRTGTRLSRVPWMTMNGGGAVGRASWAKGDAAA